MGFGLSGVMPSGLLSVYPCRNAFGCKALTGLDWDHPYLETEDLFLKKKYELTRPKGVSVPYHERNAIRNKSSALKR